MDWRELHPKALTFLTMSAIGLILLLAVQAVAQDGEVKSLDELMGEVEAEEGLDAPPSAEGGPAAGVDEASADEASADEASADEAPDDGEVKSLDELMGEIEAEGVDVPDVDDAAPAEADQPAAAGQAAAAAATAEPGAPPAEDDGSNTWFLVGLFALVLVMILLGVPLYVLIGSVTMYLLFVGGIFDDFKYLTAIIEQTRGLADQTVLLAIPFFVISGAIMTEGDIARRLIAVAESMFGKLPGGLGISTVFACAFFAAISGSSPVTVIAIGTIMYPALIKKGYPDNFSTGLVTSAGSLGILIPPSIPMIVYAIVDPTALKDPAGYSLMSAGGGGDAAVTNLFIAGLGPGLLIAGVLGGYAMFIGRTSRVESTEVSISGVITAMREGFWALLLPVLILGGIYSGIFTPTQAAAVAVVYAIIVEFFIHRSITLEDVPRVFVDSGVLMGTLLIIMALALGFNLYLDRAKIPEHAVEMILSWDLSIVEFLLIVNVLLLLVGMLMDILSAILILVPLLAPIAFGLGIHPLHMAIVFIVNLEIGYLTPPIGLNLFVAGGLFKKGIGDVMRSVLPFVALMGICLMLVTYVPAFSLGLVSLSNGGDFWIDFPDEPGVQVAEDAAEPGVSPDTAPGAEAPMEAAEPEPAPEGVKSLDELMGEVEAEEGVGAPPSE